MRPIGYLKSPYRQKFAIPRQPNLVKEAVGEICFVREFADANCLRGIDGFSHVWLLFLFHETQDKPWSATVSPPRLGGIERVGVFASRSPYRPNPIGLSAVEVVGVIQHGKDLRLRVRGIDLVDGTPILDIKPYLPYADAIVDASGGYAAAAPGVEADSQVTVGFSDNALNQIANLRFELCELQAFITAVLSQDPRPAQHARKGESRDYGMFLYDFNVRWQATDNHMHVLSVEPITAGQEPPPWTL